MSRCRKTLSIRFVVLPDKKYNNVNEDHLFSFTVVVL